MAEELWRSIGSKDFVVLEFAVFRPEERLKHIDGFTETMLNTTTDRILFLMSARWNRENVIAYSGSA